MTLPRFRFVLVLVLLLTRVSVRAAQPWDASFTSNTAAIQSAANQVHTEDGASIVILLDDQRYTVDPDGRVRGLARKVYKILREDADDDWSSVAQQYQPWRDRKPIIRARVITKSGEVHVLDPNTIADSPAMEIDASTFSDARVARAPLPAIAAGSIVEYEISTDVSPALPEAGVTRRITVFDEEQLERFHFELTAPKGVPFQTASQQIGPDRIRRLSDKQVNRVEFDLGPLKPRKHIESNLPFDTSPWPYFGFTTGRSWQAIAAKYADVVDKQIQSADLKAVMSGIDLTGEPLTIVSRLASQLHRKIRYTGVEFGENAIIPERPGDVMQRRFGDCKDKSTLLVAMLRSAGLNANVALLRSGFGADVDKDLSGIDLFDHAIVFIDLPQHPLWVDATASDVRVGDLPYADQGRLALIAARETMGLVSIPEQDDGWEQRTYEVHFSDFGRGRITEIMEAQGPVEGFLRSRYATGDDPKPALEKYVKSSYLAKAIGTYKVEGGDDLSQPVRVSVEALDTPQVMTDGDRAEIMLAPQRVLSELPWALLHQDDEAASPTEKEPRRTHDFVLASSAGVTHIYKLYPPAQYKIAELPASSNETIGPLTFSREYKNVTDGEVDVKYRLEIAKRRWTAEEYEKVREALSKFGSEMSQTIHFAPVTAELLATGEYGKAISLIRDDVEKHSELAAAHIRFSRLLVTLGLGQAARTEALKATQLDKDSSQAWQTLAWAWQNDTFGRLRQGDWNRTEALKALRKAVELDPDDAIAQADLAILLEYNNYGERYGAGSELPEAIQRYRDLAKKHSTTVLETNLTAALFYSGRLDEAKIESAKCAEPQHTLFSTAVLALQQGAAKAIVSLQSAAPDPTQRPQLIIATGLMLAHTRKYQDAYTMLQAAQRMAANPQLAALTQMIGKAKSAEEQMLPTSDPRSVVQSLFAQIMRPELRAEDIKPLLSSRFSAASFSDSDVREVRAGLGGMLRQLNSVGLVSENLTDLTLGQMPLEKKGDDKWGYKIGMPGNLSFPSVYVVREGDAYKILGTSDSAEDVGSLVLDLLKRNDIAAAQWWLDQVTPDVKDKEGGWVPAPRLFWSGTKPETRGPKDIRLAAEALLGHYSESPEAIATFEEASRTAKSAFDKGQFDFALCDALAKASKWEELAAAAKRLMTSKTFDDAGFTYLARSYRQQGNWKAMEAAALERTKLNPKVAEPWRALATARMRMGNTAGAEEAIAKLKEATGGSDASDLKVWNRILAGKVTDETVTSLRSPGGLVEGGYMVGFAEAALANTDQALDALKSAIGGEEALDARAWVLYGDICDRYGFKDAAASAWRFAREAKNKSDDAQWALATLK